MKDKTTSLINDIKYLLRRYTVLIVLFSVALYTSMEMYNEYICILFAVIATIWNRLIKYVDKQSLWILVFSISYIIGINVNSNYVGKSLYVGYLLCPFAFYLFGKRVVATSNSNSELTTFILLCILLFGLNVYIDTISDITRGVLISASRTGDSDEEVMPATLQSATVSLGLLGLSTFWVYAPPLKKPKAVLYGLLFFMSILAVTHHISRTGLVISIFCTIIVIAYKSRYNIIKSIIILGSVSLVLWLLWRIGVFNGVVLDAYIDRKDDIDQSFGTDGGRVYRWINAIEMMIKYPGGWPAEYTYIHNFWLDTQRLAGIVPFIALVIITAISIKNQIHLLSLKDNSFVAITLGLNICTFLTAFVEPILQGISVYVYFMFLLWGMQAQYIKSYHYIDMNE